MHIFTLFLALLSACASATAATPPPDRTPTDPGALAAMARDTAVALGLAVPAMRDELELTFEPIEGAFTETMTMIRVVDPDDGAGMRIVFAETPTGPRAIAAWPL
jgi:hypothetical protein